MITINKVHHVNEKVLKNNLLSTKVKIRIYETIRPTKTLPKSFVRQKNKRMTLDYWKGEYKLQSKAQLRLMKMNTDKE